MKKNDIFLILIPSFIFALAWIGFSIYHNIATSTIGETLSVQISPISPVFDLKTVAAIKTRQNIIPVDSISVPVENITLTPTPTIITPIPQQPISSGSANISTNGGELLQ